MGIWDIIKNADSVADLVGDLITDATTPDTSKPEGTTPKNQIPQIIFPTGNILVKDMSYLHPKVCNAALQAIKSCKEQGYPVTVVETYRTFERQGLLFEQGRSLPGEIVTKSQPGESYHNYGLALDISPTNESIGLIFESLGFEWGARWESFKDMPHFQMTFGYSISQLKNLYTTHSDIVGIWKLL